MNESLLRLHSSIEQVMSSEASIPEKRGKLRRKVDEVTADLDRDELIELVYLLSAMVADRVHR